METNGRTASPHNHLPSNLSGVGPEASPYSSPICNVAFKSGQRFHISSDLLPDELKDFRRSSGELRIKNIPDEAGHVLLHYLYTGTWQTLRVKDSLDAVNHSTQLEISLHVYATARTFHLPDLAEFAKDDIFHHAQELPTVEVLVLASDACRHLGAEDLWLSAFTKQRTQQLFEGSGSLNKTGFLECFNNSPAYSKMLVKRLVDMLSEKSTSVNSNEFQTMPRSNAASGLEADSSFAAQHKLDSPVDFTPEQIDGLDWSTASKEKKDKKKKKGKIVMDSPPPSVVEKET
ncbi:hypothetical protein LZ30DRAFT_828043 [Colletotrichum cereale]|nr:hypothetical protein LZ30DRAFT_828043 [Colletotrichum cereale]